MFDAKKLLDQFLGSQMPGSAGSIGQKGNDLMGMAKANPWKTGALAAVLLGTKTGRSLGSNALKIGGLAVIAGLARIEKSVPTRVHTGEDVLGEIRVARNEIGCTARKDDDRAIRGEARPERRSAVASRTVT